MASTNKTANFNLSQYVGSDKPTYLIDYNTDMLNIDRAMEANRVANQTNETTIGNLSNLQTTAKTDLVSAVNEVKNENASDTEAIQQLQFNQGNIANLNTSDKTNLVNAINEVNTSNNSQATDIVNINENLNEINNKINNNTSNITALKGSVLYDSETGSNSSISLSDSSANYDYLEILYRDNDNYYNSVKVANPNGKKVYLIGGTFYNNAVYFSIKVAHIQTNQITTSVNGRLIAGSSNTVSSDNFIYITKVIGYNL